MARCLKFLKASVLLFWASLFLCCDFSSCACVFQNNVRTYNLTALDWPNWQAVGTKNGSDIVTYDISLCKPLNYSASPEREACNNSLVCRHSGGKATEMAEFSPQQDSAVFDGVLKGGFMLFLTTSSHCSADNETDYHTIINFVCGPTLGSPEVLMESECRVHLIWKTSAACKTPLKRREVPCYVIDKAGNKISLEKLALDPPNVVLPLHQSQNKSIWISVCTDIDAGFFHCKNCAPGISAMRLVKDNQPIGQLSTGLELTEEGVRLTYGPPPLEQTLPEGCSLQPTTTVLFRCPERLKSRRPRLVSDIDCQYEVEWETEQACPQSMLKGDFKTCKFTKEVHGIDLDLSPLRKDKDFYEVRGTRGVKKGSVFILNICGGLGNFMCNGSTWASNSVCLKYGNSSEVIGLTNDASFRLDEQRISLRYEGPGCTDGKQQTTYIRFMCNPDAENNGTGYPYHILSDHCLNTFIWETKYACLPDKPDVPCSASEGNKFFDLSRLRKTWGHMWNVLSPRGRNSDSHPRYFMNVCGPVFGAMKDNFTVTDNFTKCEGYPAVSRIESGKCVNLGEFVSSPRYDTTTQSVKMEYKNGTICRGNLRWSSVVEFKCYPGLFSSDVILTHVNEAGCVNEFEFRSAVACPITSVVGKDCRLMDSQTGLNIDLSPLNSSVHEATGSGQKFYLSVCNSLPSNNSCLELLNSSQDVAACAVNLNQSDPRPQNLGAPSSEISYMYGNVYLKYASGPSSDNSTSYRTVILFMCSIHAGNGVPVFSKLVQNTYTFHWYTDLVCPQPAETECVVSDLKTGQQYDFSGLSKSKDNWVVYFDEEDGRVKRKMYLNICRSLNPAPSCDPDAAACIVTIEGEKESKYLSNVGRATGVPQLLSDDHLQLHYTNGKSCTAHGENINYSIIIHFLCSDNDMSGPRFLGKVGKCQYTFLWATKAACPSEVISVENECVLTDPRTGFTFDLTSLSSENSYNVSAKDQIYKLNICNPVVSGCSSNDSSKSNISVCEVNKDGQVTVLGTTENFTLQYVKGRDLALTYQNKTNDSKKDQLSEVVITLPCDDATSTAQLNFIESKNKGYHFELKTPLTCVQEVASCVVHDHEGNQYDLTSLFQSTRNWEVPDLRRGFYGVRYHINFCRPLIRVPDYKCPGGATGACQTNSTVPQNIGFSLGSQISVPTVFENGIIMVHFSGGDECNIGLRRSARVNLFCSHSQGELVFLGQTPECEYIFSMHTPVACAEQPAVGKNCIVSDPVFGHTFNLNSLKNKHANFSDIDGDYEYFISVCEKLGIPGACENSGACQTKPSDPEFFKNLGLPNSDLIYSQGALTLTYSFGSLCHDKYNRTAVIKFTCKHSAADEEEKPYFISEAEDCVYMFEWPTKLACPPFEVSECSAVGDEGLFYDLSDLSLTSDNYYIRNPMSRNQTFVINVCRSVVYSPDSLCPYASASCLLDPSNTNPDKRTLNIGQVTRPPYFENGKLKMKYSTGAPCDAENGHFMETIIEFTCDKQKISSEPEFIGQDVCTYYFTWSTAYACGVSDTEGDDECHVTDPYTGFEFDLTPLKKDVPYTVQTTDHKYFLNVCGDVKTSPCGGKSGVCQQELQGKQRSWNAGNANSRLLYHPGVLSLNYSGGAPCHNNAYQRNTIIQFECTAGPRKPRFLYESSDCTYYFTWGTELACQSLVHCAVKNGSYLFDLTSLTASPYHSAESHLDDDSSSYYISVCNSLNHVPGLSCPAGAAICRTDGDGSNSVSLGRVEYPPFVDFQGHATIIYTNGSKCLTNPNEQYKSRIIFKCDPLEYVGSPVLVRREDDICVNIFEWRTNIMCLIEPVEKPQAPDCFFADNSTGMHFDLSGLQKTGSHYKVDGDNGDIFLLNLCGEIDESGCGKSGVCLQKSDKSVSSYGTAASQKFLYDGHRLRAMFADGDDCLFSETGKRTAQIWFMCDPKIGLGKPKLHKKYACVTVFKWETDLVCQDVQHSCSFNIDKKNFDLYPLSSLSHNWKTTDSENNTYFLNLCRGLYNKDTDTKGCPSNAAVCMKQHNSAVSLGLVHTMTKILNDSGDLVLIYTSGSTRACSSVESHVQPLTATSKITLKCGRSWGSPKFVYGPDSSCSFYFDWKTSLACDVANDYLLYESNGTLIDERLGFEMDMTEILNSTFRVPGISQGDNYTFVINIGQGGNDPADVDHRCDAAAACQTKPKTNFYRDIGSIDSRRFYLKGSELHLSLTSYTKDCGKNKDRNVTSLFIMKCTSYAGDGVPEFLYESGGCDYIFTWDTNAVCPVAHRRVKPVTEIPPTASGDNSPEEQVSTPNSHAPAAIIAVLSIILILCPIVYIVSNKERRSSAAAKVRSVFHRVSLPHFKYRRADGEMLILINGAQVSQSGSLRDDDILS